VTGNAKKLEEVRAILGQSIPFQSLKLDCDISLSLCVFVSMGNKNYMIMGLIVVFALGAYSTRAARRT
jgi:hypothetical protein